MGYSAGNSQRADLIFFTLEFLAATIYENHSLLCVYQQNPILATGDSSVISNYLPVILIVSTGKYIH